MTSKENLEIGEPFERSILEVVHKSSESVGKLVEKALSIINSKFFPGEIVELPVLRKGRKVSGEIVESGEFNKENTATGEAYYNILLSGENKLISCVPAKDINRIKPLSTQAVENFILSHAKRNHQNSQWSVLPDLVNKHSLGPKLADIFIRKTGKIKEKKNFHTEEGTKCGKSSKRKSTEKQNLSEDHSYSSNATVKKSKLSVSRISDHSYSSKSGNAEDDDCLIIDQSSGRDHCYSSQDSGLVDSNANELSHVSGDKTDHNYSSSASDDQTDLTEHNYCSPTVSGSDESMTDHSYSSDNKTLSKKKNNSKKMNSKLDKANCIDSKVPKNTKNKKLKTVQTGNTKNKKSEKSASKISEIKDVSIQLVSLNPNSVSPGIKLKQRTLLDFTKQKRQSENSPDVQNGTPVVQAKINIEKNLENKFSVSKLKNKCSTPKPNLKSTKSAKKSKTKSSKAKETFISSAQSKFLANSLKKMTSPKASPSKKLLLAVSPLAMGSLKKYMESHMPACVRSLQLHLLEGKAHKINRSLKVCALILQDYQLDKLSADLKQMIKDYKVKIEEAQYMKTLSPEQLIEYRKERKRKNQEQKKLLKQVSNGVPSHLKEDTLLNLSPLPEPSLVDTPDGLPNECFGDVAMLVEFCNAYHSLLFPKESFYVTLNDLMTALCGGEAGYLYVNKLIVAFLNLILKEEDIGQWKNASVNVLTASEITRLIFSSDDKKDKEYEVGCDSELDDIINMLDTCDLYELPPNKQVYLLSALVNRVLISDSLEICVEEVAETLHQLHKDKMNRDKEKKSKLNASIEVPKNNEDSVDKKANTLLDYYSPGGDENTGSKSLSDTNEEKGILTTIRMRRIRTEEAKKLEQEKKERKMKEIEEKKQEIADERLLKKIEDNKCLQKNMRRVVSLGKDRHHSRYWVFAFQPSVLYVEKGWTKQYYDYSVKIEQCMESSEETMPPLSQNLWFCYGSNKVQDLLKALSPAGLRESVLKVKLKKVVSQLTESNLDNIKSYNPLELDYKLGETFKKELLDLNEQLISSRLGGLNLSGRLEKCEDTTSCSELLLKCYESIQVKYLMPEVDSCTKENQALIMWKNTVINATTWSKLQLCLSYLESYIKWERSLANKKCRVCRKKEATVELILCEKCSQTFHIYCLRPPLSSVPNDSWFCPQCNPTNSNARSRRKQKESLELIDEDQDDISDEDDDDHCGHCSRGGNLVKCSSCSVKFHHKCVGLSRSTRLLRNWNCPDCSGENSSGKKKKLKSHKFKRSLRTRSLRSRRTQENQLETSNDESDNSDGSQSDSDDIKICDVCGGQDSTGLQPCITCSSYIHRKCLKSGQISSNAFQCLQCSDS